MFTNSNDVLKKKLFSGSKGSPVEGLGFGLGEDV
jgi:hypothetical protein